MFQKLIQMLRGFMNITKRTINLTDEDNGRTIQCQKGDIVTIGLAWKPGNGYLWAQARTTAGTLEEIQHQGNDPKPGSSAIVTFTFQITQTGILELDLARPWEKDTPPVKWFTVIINVS
jgi:predicted secreted protein